MQNIEPSDKDVVRCTQYSRVPKATGHWNWTGTENSSCHMEMVVMAGGGERVEVSLIPVQ
jgi:hypothetical protein